MAEERKGFEDSRSKDNITCDFYIFNGEFDVDGIRMQRLFPREWLRKKARSSFEGIDKMEEEGWKQMVDKF